MKFKDVEDFLTYFELPLNEQQKRAVSAGDGPSLILAVPGSGKTTVLISRVGYLMFVKGIDPGRILTLTYTVAAAHDMAERFAMFFCNSGKERSGELRGDAFDPIGQPEFRTINGICAKIIYYYGKLLGRPSFTLLTDEGRISGILNGIYRNVCKEYPTDADIKSIRTQITYIKNMMLSEKELAEYEKESEYPISELYKAYCEALRNEKCMDFDDQLVYALKILQISNETRNFFQRQYQYICVDEAQDTSRIQHEVIRILAADNENLFMVGDEDQSIYGFRAAYPDALMNFEKDHPGAKVMLMEENFRSVQNIVKMSDKFIAGNRLRRKKNMFTKRESERKVRFIELKGRGSQYTYLRKIAGSCSAPTAVLFRNNESALPLIDLLERDNIPYRMRSTDMTFFSTRCVQDIVNILQFAYHGDDADLFMKIYYKLGLYMSKKDAESCCARSRNKNISILQAALESDSMPDYVYAAVMKVRSNLKKIPNESSLRAIVRIQSHLGYSEYAQRMNIDTGKLTLLKSLTKEEETPEEFLEHLRGLQSRVREHINPSECLFTLSTIHASKGLEYDNVYLMDVADGIFPEHVPASHFRAEGEELSAYEEERRLFYVAMTRAKEQLNIFKFPTQSTFTAELMKKPSGAKAKVKRKIKR